MESSSGVPSVPWIPDIVQLVAFRHQHYAKDGDHLFVLLDNAVRSGCTVWRRCRYVRTKKKAVKKEAKWLRKYDYPWNAKQNMKKRNVNLVSKSFCMCMSFVQIVE